MTEDSRRAWSSCRVTGVASGAPGATQQARRGGLARDDDAVDVDNCDLTGSRQPLVLARRRRNASCARGRPAAPRDGSPPRRGSRSRPTSPRRTASAARNGPSSMSARICSGLRPRASAHRFHHATRPRRRAAPRSAPGRPGCCLVRVQASGLDLYSERRAVWGLDAQQIEDFPEVEHLGGEARSAPPRLRGGGAPCRRPDASR